MINFNNMVSFCTLRYMKNHFLFQNLKLITHEICPIRWSSDLKAAPVSERKLIKVAIIGPPNSGKSTLINQIVKRKVLPISKKVHTTRWKARAVLNEQETQLIFVDTPGLVTNSETKKYKLNPKFISDGEEAIGEADVIGVVHDLSNNFTNEKLDSKVLRLLHIFKNKESFLVLNKIDTVKSKRQLLDFSTKLTGGKLNKYQSKDLTPLSEAAIAEIIKKKHSWEYFSDIFMISALLNKGVDDLKDYLLNAAHRGEWAFPETSYTDQKPVQIIEETVRSKLLDSLPQEVPYNLEVELEFLDIMQSGRVVAVVLVRCKSIRIVRFIKGFKGKRIKEISDEAKLSLQDTFLSDVSLTIIVEHDHKEDTLSDE